jgi:bifunctional DNA-binding transcriptional regulator/antitoxin component of YhaV-PrlF toxin-antitoxin module
MSMTVAVKNKPPVVVPPAVLRRAGFKRGQDLEVKASGGVVTIMPKLTPDELRDEREIRDPKIRALIRKGHEEFLAGKTRPIGEFFAERGTTTMKTAGRTQ